ncbi:MAG: heme exporter protein CcmB [Armatimonadota bacterium]|nr:heme exporter protein CcmB [Armatimonadota bacterium]
MGTKSSSLASKAIAVYRKDIVSEFRTRYAVNAVALFAVTTLIAVSMSVGGFGVTDKNLLSALLWVILFFSAMSGLSRVFVREEESRTASALRLSADPIAIYIGKLAFNLTLLLALEIIVVPMFVVMMNAGVRNWTFFWLILLFGSVGLSAAATIVAAIVSKANAKGALFAVLSFPILAPLLVTAISASSAAMGGGAFADCWRYLRVLVSYAGVMITASVLLFEFIWED